VAFRFMPPQFAPHRRQGRFCDGDFVRQNLDGIGIALASGVAMLAVQFVEIVGRLGVEPPKNVAYRARFDHSPMVRCHPAGGLYRFSRVKVDPLVTLRYE
jgi:hypothetical protein